jgi:hypothetical protein
MKPINPVPVTAIMFMLSLSCGCFTQHQLEAVSPTTTAANTPKKAEATTAEQSSEQNPGVMDTTGKAIGDVVLFPFRALGQALTPGQAH